MRTEIHHARPSVWFVSTLLVLATACMGQGVVTEGKLSSTGVFDADSVLAKHDENYMPPEVADMLKKKGVWRGAEAPQKPK